MGMGLLHCTTEKVVVVAAAVAPAIKWCCVCVMVKFCNFVFLFFCFSVFAMCGCESS